MSPPDVDLNRGCTYLKVHLDQLIRPFDQECGTDVEMKSRKALLLGLNSSACVQTTKNAIAYHVRIPHANRVLDAHFPHEQAIHPSEAELHELYTFLFEVFGKGRINAYSQVA